MILSAINIYPLKSARGFTAVTWEIDDFGFRYDRRWMVVDTAGQFITQRDEPRLALLAASVAGDSLWLEAPAMPSLETALEPESGDPLPVTVWRDRCDAWLPDPDGDRWLSRFLGLPCRLAYIPPSSFRRVDPGYVQANRRVSFADAFPFLLIGQASLDELNRRLAQPIPMNRFRPNLVVSGETPHAEDGWPRIQIGEMGFDLVKPCARCVVTTTDQATGRRDPAQEPLRTLAAYRGRNGEVMFGQNAIHDRPGRLRVGDGVEVRATRDES
jgi:uncharacterized protein